MALCPYPVKRVDPADVICNLPAQGYLFKDKVCFLCEYHRKEWQNRILWVGTQEFQDHGDLVLLNQEETICAEVMES